MYYGLSLNQSENIIFRLYHKTVQILGHSFTEQRYILQSMFLREIPIFLKRDVIRVCSGENAFFLFKIQNKTEQHRTGIFPKKK